MSRLGPILSLSALALALAATTAVGLRAHGLQRREAALEASALGLAAKQQALREAALAIRAGAERDYDPLAAGVRGLRDVRALGKEAPSAEVDAIAKDVADEEHTVELFKTDMALFTSSALAFPAAATLVPVAGAEATALESLRTNVLRFVAVPDRDKADGVRASLTVIESSPTVLDGPGRERRAVALGLARALIEHRDRLDQVVQTLARPSLEDRLRRVASGHAARASRALIVAAASATAAALLVLLSLAVVVELGAERQRALASRSGAGRTPQRPPVQDP